MLSTYCCKSHYAPTLALKGRALTNCVNKLPTQNLTYKPHELCTVKRT